MRKDFPPRRLFSRKVLTESGVRTLSNEPGLSTSGIDVASRIHLYVSERDRADEEKEWASLQATTYFTPGQDDVDVKLAVKKITAKMRVVPRYRSEAPHALLRIIIDKIPSQPPALANEKEKYLCAIDRAEKLREEPTLEARPLDLDRLTEWIAVDLQSHSTPQQREVSTAERQKRQSDRMKKHKVRHVVSE